MVEPSISVKQVKTFYVASCDLLGIEVRDVVEQAALDRCREQCLKTLNDWIQSLSLPRYDYDAEVKEYTEADILAEEQDEVPKRKFDEPINAEDFRYFSDPSLFHIPEYPFLLINKHGQIFSIRKDPDNPKPRSIFKAWKQGERRHSFHDYSANGQDVSNAFKVNDYVRLLFGPEAEAECRRRWTEEDEKDSSRELSNIQEEHHGVDNGQQI